MRFRWRCRLILPFRTVGTNTFSFRRWVLCSCSVVFFCYGQNFQRFRRYGLFLSRNRFWWFGFQLIILIKMIRFGILYPGFKNWSSCKQLCWCYEVHFVFLSTLFHKIGQALYPIHTLASLTTKQEQDTFQAEVAPLFFTLGYSRVLPTFHSNFWFTNSNCFQFPSIRQFPYLFQQSELKSYSISSSTFLPIHSIYLFALSFEPAGFPSIFLFHFRLPKTFHIVW